ncbi:MAG: hypothetical protein HQK67_11020 [Desulfamplus sp.]|nr:hypothetical protein [Desulfamplus sp.]
MLSEFFSQEEREQFAAVMLNSGAMKFITPKSKRDTNKFASFSPSFVYEQILATRKGIEIVKEARSTLQFDFKRQFASKTYPPVALILKIFNICAALQNGANFPEPSVLESFTVELKEPSEGFYRKTIPLPIIIFKGNFVSLSPRLAALSAMVADIAYTIGSFNRFKQAELVNTMLSKTLDGWVSVLIKEAVDGAVDVDATAQSMFNSIKNIGSLKRYDDVEFNIKNFIKDFNSIIVNVSDASGGDAIFNEYNGEVTPLKPGVMKFKFGIIDSLKEDGEQFVESELLFTIKNYPGL